MLILIRKHTFFSRSLYTKAHFLAISSAFFMTIFMAMAISVIHEREAPAIANPQIRNGWGFSFIITDPTALPPDSFSRTAHSRPHGLPLGNSRCAKIETNAIPRLRPAMHPSRLYRSTGRTGRVPRRRGN